MYASLDMITLTYKRVSQARKVNNVRCLWHVFIKSNLEKSGFLKKDMLMQVRYIINVCTIENTTFLLCFIIIFFVRIGGVGLQLL